jgi:uncharacterized protein (DUF302 family)
MTPYHLTKTTRRTFDDAVATVTRALSEQGFGVLTEIDVRSTLAKKLGVEFRPYKILGACNPTFAHRALELEDKVGTMLPCNVVVQEKDGAVEISAVDPVASMQAIHNPALREIAREVRDRLGKVIDAV